jgi:ABC-type oligopeptide transport system ATPase subunit
LGFLTDYIHEQVGTYNKNVMIILVGGCGSGKSYAGLTLGTLVDPTFGIDRVVFGAEDFLRLINSELPAGSVVMWDEAGVGIPAREWQSISNKLISYVTQTFRHQNLVVMFSVPSFDFVDKNLRALFDLCLITAGINKTEQICYLKPQFLQNNPRYAKIYSKYKYANYNGARGKVNRTFVSIPPLWLRRAYETKKQMFTNKLNKSAQKSLTESNPDFTRNQLTTRQQQAAELLSKMSVKDVAVAMGTQLNGVYRLRQVLIKKGYAV